MFVSFEVVRKCFESGCPKWLQPRGRLLEWFFFGKKNIATLQVASCDCVASCANFVCGATNATHCRGREGNVGLGCCWGGRGKSFAVALCRINFDICRV